MLWLFFVWLVSFFGQLAIALMFAYKVGKYAMENGITPEYLREHDIPVPQNSLSAWGWFCLLFPIVNTLSLIMLFLSYPVKLQSIKEKLPILKEAIEAFDGEQS